MSILSKWTNCFSGCPMDKNKPLVCYPGNQTCNYAGFTCNYVSFTNNRVWAIHSNRVIKDSTKARRADIFEEISMREMIAP